MNIDERAAVIVEIEKVWDEVYKRDTKIETLTTLLQAARAELDCPNCDPIDGFNFGHRCINCDDNVDRNMELRKAIDEALT